MANFYPWLTTNSRRLMNIAALIDEVTKVLEGMADTERNIADLGDRISRLEEASSNLRASLTEVRSYKTSVGYLVIDPKRWKGEEYKDYEDVYDSYKEETKTYVTKVEQAKETIDEDIEMYQTDLETAKNVLLNQQLSLEALQNKANQS